MIPADLGQSEDQLDHTPPNVALLAKGTAALSTRRAGGIDPKSCVLQQLPREKGCSLPEYLEASEVNPLISAAPNPQTRLVMLE